MSEVFYVNFEKGLVASDANAVCNQTECANCSVSQGKCCATVEAAPDWFFEEKSYVPIPFSILKDYKEKLSSKGEDDAADLGDSHYVVFPRATLTAVYELNQSQMDLLTLLKDLGIGEYKEVTIRRV